MPLGKASIASFAQHVWRGLVILSILYMSLSSAAWAALPAQCQQGGGSTCASLEVHSWSYLGEVLYPSSSSCPNGARASLGEVYDYIAQCYANATAYCTYVPNNPSLETSNPSYCYGTLCGNWVYALYTRTGYNNTNPACTNTSIRNHTLQRQRTVGCPAGFTAWYDTTSASYYCARPNTTMDTAKNNGCGSNCQGNPINSGTGNKFQVEVDYKADGAFPLTFTRTYNSTDIPGTNEFYVMGANWRHTYLRSISVVEGGPLFSTARAYRDDGKAYLFNLNNGVWTPEADVNDRLVRVLDGSGNPAGWQYVTGDDVIELYDVAGRLISLTHRSGLTQTLTYNAKGQLQSVADAFGRQLSLQYDTFGRLAVLNDPAGGQTLYTYDVSGRGYERQSHLGDLSGRKGAFIPVQRVGLHQREDIPARAHRYHRRERQSILDLPIQHLWEGDVFGACRWCRQGYADLWHE
ncbi:MAG TPA: DUF6531 domain-containing protein [Burkholderiales bacterium]|nr:DUF6531 domain-containing protein [Burkholderiales bacterium]